MRIAGLTPNLLCRIALVLSLDEGSAQGLSAPDEDGQELNRYTLTGEHDAVYTALLRFVEEAGEGESLSDEVLLIRLRSHIHRGLNALAVRAKSPLELTRLARVDAPLGPIQ
jgi:DNA sulfur modification protein DndE